MPHHSDRCRCLSHLIEEALKDESGGKENKEEELRN